MITKINISILRRIYGRSNSNNFRKRGSRQNYRYCKPERSLSLLGKKVIAIDTDIGLRNLDVVMGLENSIVYNIVDVIEGNCRLKQAIIRDKRFRNLYLLPKRSEQG